MTNFGSVTDLLDFAMEREEEAYQFFSDMAKKMKIPSMRKVFEDFAREELGHKKKLSKIKEGKLLMPTEKKVLDLMIGDYLVDVEPSPYMDYQEALIIAMKKEKAAFKLYMDLAAATDDPNLQATFQAFAQEEAKHKLRFEIEYDKYILTEN